MAVRKLKPSLFVKWYNRTCEKEVAGVQTGVFLTQIHTDDSQWLLVGENPRTQELVFAAVFVARLTVHRSAADVTCYSACCTTRSRWPCVSSVSAGGDGEQSRGQLRALRNVTRCPTDWIVRSGHADHVPQFRSTYRKPSIGI